MRHIFITRTCSIKLTYFAHHRFIDSFDCDILNFFLFSSFEYLRKISFTYFFVYVIFVHSLKTTPF